MSQTPTLARAHHVSQDFEPYRQSMSSLRADVRRLQRVLDWELDSRGASDSLAVEAGLVEERHALELAELILRIRLARRGG